MAGLKRNNPSLWGDCDHMVIHNPNPWTFTWIRTCTDPLGPTHCGWFQFQCPLNRARFLLGSFPLLVSFSLCIMNVVMVKMFRPLRGTSMTTKGKWCDVMCVVLSPSEMGGHEQHFWIHSALLITEAPKPTREETVQANVCKGSKRDDKLAVFLYLIWWLP